MDRFITLFTGRVAVYICTQRWDWGWAWNPRDGYIALWFIKIDW
jgi:hypothetical protein